MRGNLLFFQLPKLWKRLWYRIVNGNLNRRGKGLAALLCFYTEEGLLYGKQKNVKALAITIFDTNTSGMYCFCL